MAKYDPLRLGKETAGTPAQAKIIQTPWNELKRKGISFLPLQYYKHFEDPSQTSFMWHFHKGLTQHGKSLPAVQKQDMNIICFMIQNLAENEMRGITSKYCEEKAKNNIYK